MIKRLFFLIVSVSSMSLVGCSSTFPNQPMDAMAGAITSESPPRPPMGDDDDGPAATPALGTVAGPLFGGNISANMDDNDTTRANKSMNNNPTNKSTTWKSTTTGNTYTIAPTSSKRSYPGYAVCRRYYATATIKGNRVKHSGMACQQPDGNWQAMRA